MELTDFDKELIAKAKQRRDDMLASGAQCCGTCRFAHPPANPGDAPHYVDCDWAAHVDLPEFLSAQRMTGYTTITSGQTCRAYLPKEEK